MPDDDTHHSTPPRRAVDAAGNTVVFKTLDAACLQHGKLHPNVKERLARIRELPVRDVALLHGVEIVDGQPVLVWDYLDGKTLADCAAGSTAPGLAHDLTVLLDAVHGHGLVHGAIHARNFILDEAGKPRLTHFSPLLHYDPTIDHTDLATMLRDLGLVEPAPPPAGVPIDPPVWQTLRGSTSLWLAILLAAGSIAIGAWIFRVEQRATVPRQQPAANVK